MSGGTVLGFVGSATVAQVAADLRALMAKLTDTELEKFAENMGVDPVGLIRTEIEEECVAVEQYTFTH